MALIQTNACPNCGARLKTHGRIIKCEYCDSEFENSDYEETEVVKLYCDDKVFCEVTYGHNGQLLRMS